MNTTELSFLRAALRIAQQARDNGNHPFGAILVDDGGHILLEVENTVVTERDCTGHAELNLVRLASQQFDRARLAGCTLYTSTEPCAMCAGAIFWSQIGRVVYGLSEENLSNIVGRESADGFLSIPCREVFARGGRPTEVVGPYLEEEARQVHAGFWP